MRTERRAPRSGRNARSPLVGLAALLAAFSVLVAGVSLASAQHDDPRIPWRDAAVAAEELAEAQVRLLDARGALEQAQAELDLLQVALAEADEATYVMASELQASRDLARDLAVEAYVSGGQLTDALYILDSATANDFAFRSTLMTEGADAVARSSREYLARRAAATDEALAIAEDIEEMDRAVELAQTEIVKAERSLADAEWVMAIAEIHRAADELLVANGRTDPTEEQWEALRFCESTGNYETNTGNSFYGAYQFTVTTWIDMGGSGLPSDAKPEEQDARARYLYALRGSGYGVGGSWPLCGQHLPRG